MQIFSCNSSYSKTILLSLFSLVFFLIEQLPEIIEQLILDGVDDLFIADNLLKEIGIEL